MVYVYIGYNTHNIWVGCQDDTSSLTATLVRVTKNVTRTGPRSVSRSALSYNLLSDPFPSSPSSCRVFWEKLSQRILGKDSPTNRTGAISCHGFGPSFAVTVDWMGHCSTIPLLSLMWDPWTSLQCTCTEPSASRT